jgi:DNA repair photolyase
MDASPPSPAGPRTTRIVEIDAKSLLIRRKRVDSWFASGLGMNLYRGCAHDCAYCDGRAERYHVPGEFGRDVTVKRNALALLDRELAARRRKPLRRGYVFLGGGVGDAYQPVESHWRLARGALERLADHELPVHVLTKSSLVERDFDLLERLSAGPGAILSTSLSTADDARAAIFEPGATRPSLRLATLARARARGIATGVYLVPVIPLVTDSPEAIEQTVAAIAEVRVDFVLFGGMTLKDGRQRDHFLATLESHSPDLVPMVARLYPGDEWGRARPAYYAATTQHFDAAARRHGRARRIPSRLLRSVLGENDLATVVLEGLDDLRRRDGRQSALWRAARAVATLDRPLSALGPLAAALPGLGQDAYRLLDELRASGGCGEYDELAGT